MNGAQMREWEEWQSVCGLLKEAGAVTEADLKSPAMERKTRGQMLLWRIREWGEAKVALHLDGRAR